jgi:methylenetetrahydrofolate--tRNA-(uracil-5-)-methyltransferase
VTLIRITIVSESVRYCRPGWGAVVAATGPLTAAPCRHLAALVGQQYLSFYDAISPIVQAETIDRARVFRASRWHRSLGPAAPSRPHDRKDADRTAIT